MPGRQLRAFSTRPGAGAEGAAMTARRYRLLGYGAAVVLGFCFAAWFNATFLVAQAGAPAETTVWRIRGYRLEHYGQWSVWLSLLGWPAVFGGAVWLVRWITRAR